jgi:serine/threonine protein kinase
MEGLGDRSIRDSLPLPVARLWRRARNAKSAKDRHDTAYFAWEVSLRLGVAAAPPSDASALARGSLGTWAAALRGGDRPIQESSLLGAHAAWSEVVTGQRAGRSTLRLRDLAATLAAYRNKVIGHGSVRALDFYDEHGPRLLEALEVAWRSSLFLPEGARLAFVESIELTSTGERKARVLEVAGDAPILVDPHGVYVPAGILPRRLYVRVSGAWTPLHPWLLFDETEERLWCFNGFGRRATYLDYASGETLSGEALLAAFGPVDEELRTQLGPGPPGSDAAPSSIPDERRFGEYEVLGKLGQGGMGAVYLARQQSLGRLVALKLLPEERARDPLAVARFRREVRALARCDHPNVVKILASGETRGAHYYAMEYVDGVDIGRVIKTMPGSVDFDTAVSSACEAARGERAEFFPGLPPIPRRSSMPLKGDDRFRQIARFFAQAADGLHHLHEQGIVHRDISPANLMVTWPEERAVVMDLGLAAIEDASVSLTRDKSQIIGTLRYLAPEQLQRRLAEVDRRADVYALGATAYEALAGRPIFDGETEARLIHQVLREEPPPLRTLTPGLPRSLEHVIRQAIQKRAEDRYANACQFGEDLRGWMVGAPLRATSPGAYRRARGALFAKRWPIAALGLGAMGALIGVWLTALNESAQLLLERHTLQQTILAHEMAFALATQGGSEGLTAWIDSSRVLRESPSFVVGLQSCRRDLRPGLPSAAAIAEAPEPTTPDWMALRSRLDSLRSRSTARSDADVDRTADDPVTPGAARAGVAIPAPVAEPMAPAEGPLDKETPILQGEPTPPVDGTVVASGPSKPSPHQDQGQNQLRGDADKRALSVLGSTDSTSVLFSPPFRVSRLLLDEPDETTVPTLLGIGATPIQPYTLAGGSGAWIGAELADEIDALSDVEIAVLEDGLSRRPRRLDANSFDRFAAWIDVLDHCEANWSAPPARSLLAAELARTSHLLDRLYVATTARPSAHDDSAERTLLREHARRCLALATLVLDEQGMAMQEAKLRLALSDRRAPGTPR